jgi:hypothetical protein
VATLSPKILYEHPAEDLRAQALVQEVRAIFEVKDEAGAPLPRDDRDVLKALQALDRALEDAQRERAGPATFLETAGRVAARMSAAPRPARPLIVEP